MGKIIFSKAISITRRLQQWPSLTGEGTAYSLVQTVVIIIVLFSGAFGPKKLMSGIKMRCRSESDKNNFTPAFSASNYLSAHGTFLGVMISY